MKLKKIAALALAGVMAVSMLAGCATKPTTDEDKTETTDLSAAVVAALSEDTKKAVTFTTSDALQSDIVKVIAKYGTENANSKLDSTNGRASLSEVDTKVYNKGLDGVSTIDTTDTKKDAEEAAKVNNGTYSATEVVTAGVSTQYAVKQLAAVIDQMVKNESAKMPEQTAIYTDSTTTKSYRVTFEYTGNVAVYTTTDATTGVVSYYLAYTMARTGSVVEL